MLQAGHQLVDDVLHDPVQFEVEQRLRLVDLGVAHGAVLAGLQVLHDAALADWGQGQVCGGAGTAPPQDSQPYPSPPTQLGTLTGVQALGDGGGVDEVPGTQETHDVLVQLLHLHLHLLLRGHPTVTWSVPRPPSPVTWRPPTALSSFTWNSLAHGASPAIPLICQKMGF